MNIYLDNAATTKPKKEVVDAIIPYLTEEWYNPSSLYNKGKRVKNKIEEVRKIVAESINAKSNEIYFTSGATESNNWVMRGFNDCYKNSNIIISPIEHKSIMDNVINPAITSDINICRINKDGLVNLEYLDKLLYKYSQIHNKILVSIIFANNEIGVIQNIKDISDIVHKYNGIFHTDATQAFGHIPIDVKEYGIDLLSASAQKLGGIKGTGFLYKRNGIRINPLIWGSQERGERGGTENVIGIISLGKAIELIDFTKQSEVALLRNYFIEQLTKNFDCKINCDGKYRLPNNISVTFNHKITGEALIYSLESCGIYISAGSACNSESAEPSYVLQAIGLTDEEIYKTIRISLPDDIDKESIDKVICEIKNTISIIESAI